MSVNIKFGDDTYEGVSTVRLVDADTEEKFDVFRLEPDNTWTVTFMDGEDEYSIQSIVKGTSISQAPVYPKTENYKSIGWCTDTTNENSIVSFPYTPTANITLYAYYVEKEQLKTPTNVELDEAYIFCDSIPQATEYEVWNYNDPDHPVLLGSIVPENTFRLNIEGNGVVPTDDSPIRMPIGGSSDGNYIPIIIKSQSSNNYVAPQYNVLNCIGGEYPIGDDDSGFPISYTVDNFICGPLDYEQTRELIPILLSDNGFGQSPNGTQLTLQVGATMVKQPKIKNRMGDFTYLSGVVLDEENGEIIQGSSNDGIFYLSIENDIDIQENGFMIALNGDYSTTFKLCFSETLPQVGTTVEGQDIYSSLSENDYIFEAILSELGLSITPKYICLQICDSSDVSNDIMEEYVSVLSGDKTAWENLPIGYGDIEANYTIYEDGPDEDVNIYVKVNGSPKDNNDYSFIIKADENRQAAIFDRLNNNLSNDYSIMNVLYLTCWTDSVYNEYADFSILDGDVAPSRPIFKGYKNFSLALTSSKVYFDPWIAGNSYSQE